MEGSVEQLLVLTSEVSIATVALSGIVMILATTNLKLSFDKSARILGQLNMASVVTIFAMVPLFLDHLDISQDALWRIASSFYLGTVVFLLALGFKRAQSNQKTTTMVRIVSVPGLSALVLLPLNILFVSVWPYLFQLLIAWVVSVLLFLMFIAEFLQEKVESGAT